MSETLMEPVVGRDPRIGMILQDRYRIVRTLGEGGMGTVYEGEHVLIKRRVAIKCLHAQFAQNPAIVARFHREALAATSVGHPNIVEVTDMGRFPDNSVFMVLEFLEGRDWADDIAHQGPQPAAKTIRILSQVCDGLAAAHAKGIIHRDLKPENIFLVARGDNPDFAKIVDFGISKFHDSGDKSMTKTGTTLGTPYYMSPEQAQGKKDVGQTADIYSLGVILFQALTAQFPFDDDAYPMLVVKICTEPAPPLSLYRPDLPAELSEVVARCLRKEPSARFASCAELKAALAPFRDLEDDPSVTSMAPPTASLAASALQSGVALANTVAVTSTVAPIVTQTDPGPVRGAALDATRASLPAADTAPPARARNTDDAIALPPASASRAPLVGVLVGLGVVIAGVTLVLGLRTSDADESALTEAPPRAPEASAATPHGGAAGERAGTPSAPSTAPSGAPTGAQVTVQITTVPEDAEVYLDGRRIPNPFDGELPQTEEPRTLEVRAEGYTTKAQDLVLSFPQRVRIRLEPGEGVDDRSSRARASAGGSSTSTSSMRAAGSASAEVRDLPPPPSAAAPSEVRDAPAVREAPAPTPAPETNMALKQIRF